MPASYDEFGQVVDEAYAAGLREGCAEVEAKVRALAADLDRSEGGGTWLSGDDLRAAVAEDAAEPEAEDRAHADEQAIRERIAQDIEADYERWAALSDGTRINPPLHSPAWFAKRVSENAARIAREGGQPA